MRRGFGGLAERSVEYRKRISRRRPAHGRVGEVRTHEGAAMAARPPSCRWGHMSAPARACETAAGPSHSSVASLSTSLSTICRSVRDGVLDADVGDDQQLGSSRLARGGARAGRCRPRRTRLRLVRPWFRDAEEMTPPMPSECACAHSLIQLVYGELVVPGMELTPRRRLRRGQANRGRMNWAGSRRVSRTNARRFIGGAQRRMRWVGNGMKMLCQGLG